ncbi:MAG: mechanosensitive ion channel [Thermaerobacterales bacterium]
MMIDFGQLAVEDYVVRLLAALAVLVLGWLAALILSSALQAVLRKVGLDERVAGWTGEEAAPTFSLQRIIGKTVFYLLMLFVLVGFFQTLGLPAVTQPLSSILDQIFSFAPRLVAAGALLLVAWIVASLLRLIVGRALTTLNLEKRVSESTGADEDKPGSLTRSIGSAVYWLVFLLFLPALLDILALQGLLGPIQGMLDNILSAVPQAVAAGLILVVGWFLARMAQRIVENLLSAIGSDRLGENLGMQKALGEQSISSLGGLLTYLAILIPTIIAALDTLGIRAVSDPAVQVLGSILGAIPPLLAAAVLLGLAYLIAKVASGVVSRLLDGVGFNHVLSRLGFRGLAENGRSPSEIAGWLVMIGIMLFASIEAAYLIGFSALAALIVDFTRFAGQVLLGVAVFGLGLYGAQIAHTTIASAGTQEARWLAAAARVGILFLAGALALGHINIAGPIVNVAFTALIGALALAVAIAVGVSFGLGGRETAGRLAEQWTRKWVNKSTDSQGE